MTNSTRLKTKNETVDAFQNVQALLQRHNPDGIEITRDLKLNEDLGLDSVTAMDLIMEIEDEFELDIPLNLIADIEKVQDLVDLVEKRLAES